MEIDSQEKEISSKYTFKERGSHTVLLYIKKKGQDSMSRMFEGCTKLVEISFNPYINTKNLIKIDYMFRDCISLELIDLSSFNTENVNEMQFMFYNCTSLTSINLSNFNTINVKYMDHMFSNCISLKSIDLSSFNTKNVYDMEHMFHNCSEIIFIDISNFITDKEKEYLFSSLPPKGTININRNSKNKFYTIPNDWTINYL